MSVKIRLAKQGSIPRVPIGRERTQDEFWLQQGTSGAINAFRQLTTTRQKAGRKKISLPGGKLKPLFKNHAAPPRNMFGRAGVRQVLPSIEAQVVEPTSTSQYVMSGHHDNLPATSANTVRVYLCSNYEDMKAERATLTKYAVPQLQEFCSEHGLYFQLVDLHWGVVGGAHQLQSTSNLRLQEIKACHQLSIGPAFVMLVGDKYGAPRLLPRLSIEEFTAVNEVAAKHEVPGAECIHRYYKLDKNCQPAQYVLDSGDGPEDLGTLYSVLRKVARLACKEGELCQSRYEEITMSVLEEEVDNGVFPLTDPRHQCLLYRREWQDIDQSHNEVPTMVDMVTDSTGCLTVDLEKQKKLKALSEKIHQHLGPSHCKPYYLKWSESAGRTWSPTPEFQTYLDTLCADFVGDCKHLILQGLDRAGEQKAVQLSVYPEVLFHSHMWGNKSEIFHGQDDLIFKVENFLQDPRRNMKPFIIHGPHGSGKSSTMAYLAKRLRQNSTASSVIVLRFLGTSAGSSSLYHVVVSITMQICIAYGLKVPQIDIHMDTLYKALRTFRDTIEAVSLEQASGRPLFILLDGIDQLQPIEESLRALWAIRELPHSVHMIISTVEKVGHINLLHALQNHISGADGCLPIATLTRQDAKDILNSVLKQSNRVVTSDQEDTILSAFEANPDPLFLQALVDYAIKLTSFSPFAVGKDADVKKLFLTYLSKLESIHGENTIRNIVCIISVSGIGIHEKELLDLLTCDPDVMEDVHGLYIINPDNVAAFPALAWAQIKEDLADVFEEHNMNGKTVIGWKHMLYTMTIGEQFGIIYPGISQSLITNEGTALTLSLHEYITNLYLHENKENHSNVVSDWSLPPVLDEEGGVSLVSPQPVNIDHVLKLQKLPLHFAILLPVEGIARLTRVMFGSLDWLTTKIKAFSVASVLQDITPVISVSKLFVKQGVIKNDALIKDLEVIYEFLQLSQGALIKDPDCIVNEILARLPALAERYPTVASLVEQARSAANSRKPPSLVPLYPCLPSPCNPLRHTFAGVTHIVKFLEKKKLAMMLCAGSSLDVWKLETGELVHRYEVNPEQSIQGIIPLSNEELAIIAHYSHLKHIMLFGVWSIDTGIPIISSTFQHRFETFTLDPDDKILMVSTVVEVNRASDIWQRCLLGVQISTREIVSTLPVEDIHKEGINEIVFARNVNAAVNGMITVGAKLSNDLGFWDLDAGKLVYCLALGCFADSVKVLQLESLAVCVSSYSGQVVLVDLESGTIRQQFASPNYIDLSSFCISDSAEYILLATLHQGIAVISTATGEQTKAIGEKIKLNMRPSNGKPPTTVPIPTVIVMDDDEHYLYVGCLNGSVKIYCIATGEHLDTLHGHTKTVNSLKFDRDGKLYSTGDDRVGRVWYVKGITDTYEKHYTELGGDVGKWDEGQFEQVFDFNVSLLEKEIDRFPTERMMMTSLAMTADEKFIVTSSPRAPVKLWSTEDGRLVRSYRDGCRNGASYVYFAYRDQFVVAHCNDPATTRTKILQVWKRETGDVMKVADKQILVFTSCQTTDGSKIFVVGPSEKKASGIVLGLYDLFELQQVAQLPCNIYGSMDSTNMFLLGCITKSIRDTPSPSEAESKPDLNAIAEEPEEDNATEDSPDNTTSAPEEDSPTADAPPSGEDSKEADTEPNADETKMYAVLNYCPEEGVSYFFNFTIGEKISMERHVPFHMDTKSPQCSVLLTDGIGVSGAVDGSLVVWDVVKHEVLANMVDPVLVKAVKVGGLRYASSTGQPGHDGVITSLKLSSNKRHLVTTGVDMKVRVWNAVKRELVSVLNGHSDFVLSAEISLDGGTVVSGSADENLILWNTTTGNKLSSFCAHKAVNSVVMATTASRVFALCGNKDSNLVALQITTI